MLIRTAIQVLLASGSLAFALTEAFSTVPPAHRASVSVVPAVGELIVTLQVPSAPVVQPSAAAGTNAADAPFALVRCAVTASPANGVHAPSETDLSSVIV